MEVVSVNKDVLLADKDVRAVGKGATFARSRTLFLAHVIWPEANIHTKKNKSVPFLEGFEGHGTRAVAAVARAHPNVIKTGLRTEDRDFRI